MVPCTAKSAMMRPFLGLLANMSNRSRDMPPCAKAPHRLGSCLIAASEVQHLKRAAGRIITVDLLQRQATARGYRSYRSCTLCYHLCARPDGASLSPPTALVHALSTEGASGERAAWSMDGVAITTQGPLTSGLVACTTCLNLKGLAACTWRPPRPSPPSPAPARRSAAGSAGIMRQGRLDTRIRVLNHLIKPNPLPCRRLCNPAWEHGYQCQVWVGWPGTGVTRHLEGRLDILVHHLDVRLED